MFYLLFFWVTLGGVSLLTAHLVFRNAAPPRRIFLVMLALPVLFLAYWVGLTWILGLFQFLGRWSLLSASTALLFGIYLKNRNSISWDSVREGLHRGWASRIKAESYLPLAGAGLVLLWKGWVLPTCNTDALYLHLPRAVWISRNSGFSLFQCPQPEWASHASFPLNYEAMLAGIVTLTKSDTCTEWFTTLSWGFLLLTVAALVGLFYERFSGKAMASLLMLFASIPVLILHGAADKVDLAVAVVFSSGLFWLYWWIFEDARPAPLLLAWSGACLALGFKRTGLLLVAFFCAVLFVQGLRSSRADWFKRKTLGTALSLVLVGALLGLFGFAYNRVWFGSLFGGAGALDSISVGIDTSSFFDLRQLVAYPLLLNLVPFSSHPSSVWVPWASAYWYWPATNLFFSHWGVLFNAAYVVSFVASLTWIVRCVKGERKWVLPLMALGLVLVLTAKSYCYQGGFNAFPRFTLYYAVFLAVFLLWPPLWRLASRSAAWTRGLYLGSALFFCGSFIYYLVVDTYAPLMYAWERNLEKPALRRKVAANPYRLPCMLDNMAAPTDVVAADLTYHTWVHPLYGAELRRPVHILQLEGERFRIPAEAKWILADNIANMVWNASQVKTAGDQLQAFGKGEPSERDTLLFRQMKDDPAFECEIHDKKGAQCLFRRR